MNDTVEANNKLIKYYHVNRIYLDEEVCNRIDAVLEIINGSFLKYSIGAGSAKQSTESFRFLIEAWEALQKDVPPIKKDLESQFRQTLATGSPVASVNPPPESQPTLSAKAR
jgi:hypothetical protein